MNTSVENTTNIFIGEQNTVARFVMILVTILKQQNSGCIHVSVSCCCDTGMPCAVYFDTQSQPGCLGFGGLAEP